MSEAPIFSASELAAYLSGDPQMALDAALAEVRRYCGWHIAPSRREFLAAYPDGADTMLVPSLRVSALHAATRDGETIDPQGWDCRENGVVKGGPRTGKVVMDVTHGFDELPGDVAAIVLAVAARSQLAPDGMPTARVQVGQIAESYQSSAGGGGAGALFASERQTLDSYRLPPRP